MAVAAAPTAPRFEHRTDASPVLGMGACTPRLSWTVAQADEGYEQTAYEVEVTRDGNCERYQVDSNEQVLVPWPAEPLASRESAEVRVRVAHKEEWSEWGQPAVVEAGLLDVSDWTAAFVSPTGVGDLHSPAPVLSGLLEVPSEVVKARLYATAHGLYVATLNGRRVGDLVLTPGWTAYQNRLRYQTYDVTDLVHKGRNSLDVLLGNGWYRGRLGFNGERALYGDRLALLAQLEVTTADGQVHILATDGSWTARESEVLADDLYDGQRTDLRRRGTGRRPATGGVEVVAADFNRLVAPTGPPVRAGRLLAPERVWTSPSGRTLVDFGQVAVGWVRLRVRGLAPGSEVVVRHAEVLENGELGTRPLRTAQATDSYLVAGGGEEELEPSLTFHGFRYAEVSGVAGGLRGEDIEAVVIGSDLRRTGWFTSSHELLNRFHENVVRSMHGNFVDVPTDCPQRDERLGWTGDIQVFAPTATFLFDTAGFLDSWLADLAAEQNGDGSVPFVVPDVLHTPSPTAAAWGDAATVVPWVLYQRTGDQSLLERQLPSMRSWVDRLTELAGPDRLWTGGFQFGDWLDPNAPPEDPARAKADPDVVATAHLARSAEIVAATARVLGRCQEADHYHALATEVREAFARAFVTPAGRVLSDAQTVYALAIEWALLPGEKQRAEAGRRLADLVRASGFRISTGFVGTPLVTDALASTGHSDVAYRLLLQTGCPSWLYPVTMGATTVWERWDSMLPDGSINPGEMTSFNHYALGAVADWLHRRVAGLAPAAPGYREILVRPLPSAALTSASARHLTPYGEARVAWARADGQFRLDVHVPVGVTAHVQLPGATTPEKVEHGDHHWKTADPVQLPSASGEFATIRDVLDDPITWSAVVAAATDGGIAPAGEAQAAGRLGAHLDAPAANLVRALEADEFSPYSTSFRHQVDAILSRPEPEAQNAVPQQ
ncbi:MULTISPECIES: family 78 glycoside hydrolase catalytic domain [unclassified Streptomyces]|uniref:family 78 glycoside hydrolase catalytic domain n=1 Tax=unclassified Streptomyces TaxID=2593676 RepID=UPI002E3497EB|nr:family 78 glycoside hydrolase catalytic domain [Streptomyces sp. NBC_01261]WSX55622.1 glycoside hydrolase family 78 protein [Streptomyces sp. NBC_00986]